MLHQPTIEKLLAMRMEPMVETWRSFEQASRTKMRNNSASRKNFR